MSTSNLVVLLGLVCVTGAASWASATRLGFRPLSERLLAAFVLGNLLVLAPVFALAAVSMLTPANTVLATLVVGVLALVAAGLGGQTGRHLVGALPATNQFTWARARLARGATDCTLLVVAPLIGMLGLVGWLVATSYFAPSFRAYDAPWYHEPITAFAIQERGLHVPPLA